jgi:sorbin and SH3 domain containing protein 1
VYKKKLPHDERAIINSEIICYPITNISRPLDMFGPFPKAVKSFVPVVPPQPPNRKSSRTNSTLKIVTHLNKTPRAKSCSKHDALNVKFMSSAGSKKSDINRSRSAGPSFISTYVSSLRHNEEKNFDSQTKLAKRICYRASSSSPIGRKLIHERKSSQSPVAFGRGISKERAFAVEKKKVEEKLAKISKDLHVSTRILRNPQLRSPNEVKQAVQNTFKPIAYVKDPKLASLMVRKSLESQSYAKSANAKSEQKSLKVTVAISSRGREIMRTSAEAPRSIRQTPSNVSSLSSKSSLLTKGKLKAKSKGSAVTSSNNSLARTNSTYSIDSNLSKKKMTTATTPMVRGSVPHTITSQKLKKSSSKASSADKSNKRAEKREPKKYFQDSTVDDNRETVESLNEAIVHQNEAIRSNAFFQKLFLRENLKRYGSPINPKSSVLEKAQMWNALASCKSEPSLRHANQFLHQSRPVSRSKFREFEKHDESECYAIFNRPTQHGENALKGGFVMEQIYKYDSLYQLSDEDEFGNNNRGRSLDYSYSYHERSNSEPPTKTVMTELVRPYSPVIIYGRNKSVETEKRQRSSRSPSCRRIQSLKTNKLMELSSYQKEIVRAQSVGRTDRAKEKLLNAAPNLYRSKSLNILNYEKHLPVCGHKKNERFRDLRDFYACLERVGQLECATSKSDLRPRRRNEEIIDYDLWQKVREYEKNERELNILLKKLKSEQRDKDFLFQPHSADEFRWTADGDLGLVTKEKSVENLKELFHNKIEDEEEEQQYERDIFDGTKDNYKPLWRASSVLDLASNMTQKYNKEKPSINTLPKAQNKHEKTLGFSRKLLSTLSKDQLKKIKNQLSEIYSSANEQKAGSSNIENYVVTVPPPLPLKTTSNESEKSFLTVRSHSELTKDQIHEPSVDISTLKNVFESKSSTTASEISESEKRTISHTLSQEIKDKFSQRKKKKNPDIERVKKIESAISTATSKALPNVKQPKKDIAFTFQEAPPAASKYLNDCLPAIKKMPVNETESISSETSNRTVIFRDCGTSMDDVHTKIKYYEEIEKEKDKVASTIYHARDDSSPDDEDNTNEKNVSDIKHSSATTEKVSSIVPKLSSSQSFTDLKEYFGERSSMKSNGTLRGSSENFGESIRLLKRSRSTSPDSERCYKSLSEIGDVEKLKMKFENFSLAGDDDSSCHYIFSDSELNKASSSVKKTRIRGHEYGNVSHITHKYEMQSKRARSRTRRTSPILKNPIKRDDRLMPHINVISKTASLKERPRLSASNRENLDKIEPIPSSTGEVVARIKHKFETLDSNLSLMGKMYTSVPDFRELEEISPHLSHLPYCGNFVSHQYPRPEDNNRSVTSPDKSPPGVYPRKRPSSSSPIRKESMNVTKQLREIFSDDAYESQINRSRYRYLPDRQLAEEYLWQKKQRQHVKSSSVSFKGHWH